MIFCKALCANKWIRQNWNESMRSNIKLIDCEWCKKVGIQKKCLHWYNFHFCCNKCATAWGKSDRRPHTPTRKSGTYRAPDYGGPACF